MIHEMVEHLRRAQEIASSHGFTNILQPGLVKEMIIADILGHQVHATKHDADAWDKDDPSKKYEYLTAVERGGNESFYIARMLVKPEYKQAKSLERITRNAAFFCATFKETLRVHRIYRVPTQYILEEAQRRMAVCTLETATIAFTTRNLLKNGGEMVYAGGKLLDV